MAKPIILSVPDNNATRVLKWTQALSFTVGHILNDLCGSMWYTYILLFLVYIEELPSVTAGIIMTAGLASDAFFTPIVAYETDRGCTSSCISNYGKRKTVHLFGSLAVAICFPIIFSDIVGDLDFSTRVAVTVLLACIYQFGFACIQISHLSMIPQLTPNLWERDELNIYRFCGDVLSDITVFVITYLVLVSTSQGTTEYQLEPSDSYKLRNVALIITSIGVVCTLVYHLGTPEENNWTPSKSGFRPVTDEEALLIRPGKLGRRGRASLSGWTGESGKKSWKDWLSSGPEYYQVGLLLILGRLYNNVNTSILPLYLSEGLEPASVTYLAIIPLLLNLSCFIFSILIKFITKFLSKKAASMLGSVLAFSGCIWLSMDSTESIRSWAIYPLTILMGGGGSMLQVIALNYTSDMIGHNTESASFVYGSVGFLEKLTNGVFILLVQLFRGYCEDCDDYYRRVLSHGSSSLAILSLVVVLTLRDSSSDSLKESRGSAGQALPSRPPTQPSSTSVVVERASRKTGEGAGLQPDESLMSSSASAEDYGSLTRGFLLSTTRRP